MASPSRNKVIAALCAAAVAAMVWVALRQHRSAKSAKIATPSLPPGSFVVASASPAPPSLSDPSAHVAAGPPTSYHLDPAHTNRSPFIGPTQPHLRWTFDAKAPIETAPAVLPSGAVVFGTLGGRVIAVSPEGSELFSVDLHDRVYASPLVLGESIYVGSDAKRLFAITHKGSIRLQIDADGQADTAPAAGLHGAIIFAAGQTLAAVRSNGTFLWRVKAKRKIYSSPAVAADGTVYVGAQDNRLYAISEDGSVKHSINLGSDVDCAPSVGDDGTVYVGLDDRAVVAIDPTGSVRWRANVGGFVRGGLTLTRNRSVVAGVYGPSPAVVSLDADTGAQRWRTPIAGTGAPEHGVHGSPVEDAAGNLFFGAQDDHVYALTSTGGVLWKLRTGADVDAAVVLASHGVLYAGSDDGKLYAIDQGTGP